MNKVCSIPVNDHLLIVDDIDRYVSQRLSLDGIPPCSTTEELMVRTSALIVFVALNKRRPK